MNSLVVGSTSQISHYFPKGFSRVSSRDYGSALEGEWDSVYLCFGENRTYLADSTDPDVAKRFHEVNCDKTVEAVEAFMPRCRRVVVYSTAELWNDWSGPVNTNTPFQFKPNHYILSKYNLTMELLDKKKYSNVSIAYPFNFNGIHRSGDFLFGKVFASIIQGHKIELGDTYYYRDILHPSMAAIESTRHAVGKDFMIGSGRVLFVNDLIRSLYSAFGMRYEDMVTERISAQAHYRYRIFYSATPAANPFNESILQMMVDEIKGVRNGN